MGKVIKWDGYIERYCGKPIPRYPIVHRPLLSWLLFLFSFGLLAQQSVSLEPRAGFYSGPQSVRLISDAEVLRYTLDGSTPTLKSPVYTGSPLLVSKTAVIRVLPFDAAGAPVGHVHGATYLIDEPNTQLLTLSVGIDPWRLFHPVHGWFLAGPGADPDHWKQPGANFWTQKEHPAHLDLIEEEGNSVHGGTVGFRMFGGMSRLHAQKSFSLSARQRYGKKRIDYPLFGKNNNGSFRFLVVRNGGSDWGRSYVRDALLTSLLQDKSWNLDYQQGRPVQVYLNGKYWGIYHLREKINPQFLEDRYDIDKDSLSLLEHEATRKHGTVREYERLRHFIIGNDLSDPTHYAHLQTLMDVDNFQRLQIAQTYFDNRDAGGNIRFWRPHGSDQRFRWILYDVDQGFGLHRDSAWTSETLDFYTDPSGPPWPNPPWSTLIQRKLLANPEYRRNFVNRSLDYLHTDFSPEAVGERADAAIGAIAAEMPRHLKRWRGKLGHWKYHTDRVREFGQQRPAFLREHLRDFFGGGPDREVTISAGQGGYISLNDNLNVGADALSGRYFANFPISLAAIPEPGYHFTGWAGLPETVGPRHQLNLLDDRGYVISATFQSATHPLADQIIINEVSPRNRAGGDWLELHNRGEEPASLEGWFLTDNSGRRFYLPRLVLEPGDYLAVCQKEEKFRRLYPSVYGVIGGLPFGLHKEREHIGLYSADGSYVNAINYQLPPPTDTTFTYALALPGLDNGKHRNWVVQADAGTPGAPNPAYLSSAVVTSQSYWLRIGVGLSVLMLIAVIGARRK